MTGETNLKGTLKIVYLLLVAASAALCEQTQFKCPADGIFANPNDCSTYFLCTGGSPFLMDCPLNTLFDPVHSICNNAAAVSCQSETSRPSTTQPTTTSSTRQPTTTSSTTTTTTQKPSTDRPPSTLSPNCPESGVQLLPNPSDCTTFFVCIEGRHDVESCPPGYGFNSLEGRCEQANNDCQIGGAQTTTPSPNGPKCPTVGQSKLPNTDDCTTFYLCQDGFSSLITCPVNYQYDPILETCLKSWSTRCGDTSSTPNPIDEFCATNPDGSLFPDSNDCTKFYQCSHGSAIHQICPPGLAFNKEKSTCDSANNVNCSATKSNRI